MRTKRNFYCPLNKSPERGLVAGRLRFLRRASVEMTCGGMDMRGTDGHVGGHAGVAWMLISSGKTYYITQFSSHSKSRNDKVNPDDAGRLRFLRHASVEMTSGGGNGGEWKCGLARAAYIFPKISSSFSSNASPRKFLAMIFPFGSIRKFCGIPFTAYKPASLLSQNFKSETCVQARPSL
jgi:hypothetical protein